MAFNKSKALETALKYLNQGKTAQAIGEYQQILRHDAKDQATLMTVGDLFARQGDMPQAIEYFERLAQVYLNDGFNSKAIAIYKKIAKLAPNELAPLERLADLYVQQGVLSEARPLFLQIAEAHLKANRAPKAVEVLHRLLEVEPDNPRVQMRLAELYNVMGLKKEAGQTYLGYAQRLYDRGEGDEAEKLIERALGVDSGNTAALLLKAKILGMARKNGQAIAILERHPEADAGTDVTILLIDLELGAGQMEKAADRARNQLVRGSSHSGLLQKVAEHMLEAGQAQAALPLLRELRDPMIEAGEQDRFQKLLSSAAEKLPGEAEPLEMLADFSRHTSDPFHLNAALTQLADIYAASGNQARAEEVMNELIEKNKGDERLVARRDQLRAGSAGKIAPPAAKETPESVAEVTSREGAAPLEESSAEALLVESAPQPQPHVEEEPLDEETQAYVSQALTDVDLFSSYGLTQKATHLLENVLRRAPRHTPTLERLLDLYLGAGNQPRTAELAAQLEQIHRGRGDTVQTERFAELHGRYEKALGTGAAPVAHGLPTAIDSAAAPSIEMAPAELNVTEAEEAAIPPAATVTLGPAEFEIQLESVEPESEPAEASSALVPETVARHDSGPVVENGEEVDLSDEWEAMVQETDEAEPAAQASAAILESTLAQPEEERIELEAEPEPEAVPIEMLDPVMEPVTEPVTDFAMEQVAEPVIELSDETPVESATPEPVALENAEFELELTPEAAETHADAGPATTEDFLSELALEVEDMESPVTPTETASVSPMASASLEIPEVTEENLNELAEVFQEFRSELDELGEEEDEDLETHYNLGIAYREMGLLDEAIGEFQKVAKAVQKGKPFRYAMNCSTMLALCFMDKGEPKIASLWYQRALELPGLEQETILALRYDLGVSLDMAGESTAALDSFRHVYAMNIDYRDVADRIATLQKH